ncbi:MAG: Gfo/Idh/MocA family oxidoreductase [Armatimonadetes bacterium]|nr:Gfo/Idh/MocA family oxidoreductase [Armatimonadota bacterium]
MAVRIGVLSVAHMHSHGYAHGLNAHPEAELAGVWDDDNERGKKFADRYETDFFDDHEALLAQVDGVVITGENKRHAETAEWAANAGKHILCEKPLVTTEQEGERMSEAVEKAGVRLMAAFPCRYSPAFQRLKERVKDGEIGRILAVCATNHGMCPFGWFVETEKSGGGAMMDHTVHVADLLRDLLQSEPVEVYAQTGNKVYNEEWEDTAFLHVRFENGVFTTIDSSWSRPQSYKTWGDVRMNVVGEKGVIELDMFAQAFDRYANGPARHSIASYGSDLDAGLIADFVRVVQTGEEPPITFHDGLQAARIAMAGYRSAGTNEPAPL